MSKRHTKLGIKQTIRKDWMDRVVQMLLAGMSEPGIRTDLNDFLATQKQSGGIGKRGKSSYGMATCILASWFAPEKELISFRNSVLVLAKKTQPKEWLPLHWAIISASYPFWYHVAKHVGRVLGLQDVITQKQIFSRMREQFGDRETVARNARYVVRSLVAWGVLKDTNAKGCYEKADSIKISDIEIASLLLESSLHASPDGKGVLELMRKDPAFYAYQLPLITGQYITQNNDRMEVVRCGTGDELVVLKND